MEADTLSDLIFRIRDLSVGRSELLSAYRRGARETFSAGDFLRGIHSLALALERQGVTPAERVAIYAENRPEWHIVDLACQLLGVPTVPLDPILTGARIASLLRNSGSRRVFYDCPPRRDVLLAIQETLTSPLSLVAMDAAAAAPEGTTLTRLMGQGAELSGDIPLERLRGRPKPDDLASILYSRQEQGELEGAMLTHRHLIFHARALGKAFPLGSNDRAASLPSVPQAYQRTLDHLCFYRGAELHYLHGDGGNTAGRLRQIRPTLLCAAPNAYRSLYEDLIAGPKQGLADRLLSRRLQAFEQDDDSSPAVSSGPGLPGIWGKWVFGRQRARIGGHVRCLLVNGPGLDATVAAFFQLIGLPVYSGLGAPGIPILAVNAPGRCRPGSVGQALPGIQLSRSSEGEILAKGPITERYWEDPAASSTAMDSSGWLRTGILGRLDSEGFLFLEGSG